MTEYVILFNYDCSDLTPPDWCWQVVGEPVKANSARRALAAANVTEGLYVAIPARSWRPLEVKVEQTTKVTIG